jgi:hypothetical protein
LNDKPTLQEVLEIQEHFRLPSPALVEKDWHVIKALAAIAAANKEPFQLVFGGGTALGRAYRLIRRMSEDLDLRIVAPEAPTRAALRTLRKTITDALLDAGFNFDPNNKEHREVMYEGRYTIYRLPYEPVAKGQGILRPEIQIETAVFPIRRPAIHHPVSSFIAEGFSRPPEVPAIGCVEIPETIAEKFVGLTRRAGAELAGLRNKRDHTLVRHIHDIHVTRDHYDVADVVGLAREVMLADAATRGQHFPAYRENPIDETLKAIDGIAADPQFAADYAKFSRDMVYGEAPNFDTAITTLKMLGGHLKP